METADYSYSLLNACKCGSLTEVKELVETEGCDPCESDESGITPLHQASGNGHLDVARFLVEEVRVDIEACKDRDGMSPVHHCCWKGHMDVLKYFIEERGCDPNATDNQGWTLLHHCCGWGQLNVTKYLIEVTHCDTKISDNDDRTPLDYCCRWGHFEVAKYLIANGLCSPCAFAKDGLAPFHSCCCAIIFSCELLEYLLRDAKCDPNLTTASGCTALTIASTNQAAVRLLLAYGARPPYEEWDKYLKGSIQQPMQPRSKLLLIGDPEGGKTTLIKSIEKESDSFLASVKNAWVKVSDENLRTVGIIPRDIHTKQLGYLTVYDMAGHPEFYASHDAALRSVLSGSLCTILLVADISKGVNNFRKRVLHWINFAENLFNDDSHRPFLVIIGSHFDLVDTYCISEYEDVIKYFESKNIFSSFLLEGFVSIDCRYSSSQEMTTLRSILSNSCTLSKEEDQISFREHCFYVFIMDRFRGQPAILVQEFLTKNPMCDEKEKEHSAYIPNDVTSLCKMCAHLNKRGNIMFFPNQESPELSWIVLQKKTLLNRVNGSIFAPKDFPNIASDTGIVPHTRLQSCFPDLNMELIISFMTHLQFCHEVTDHEVLAQLIPKYSSLPTQRFLFFPGLVTTDTPEYVWDVCTSFPYESVWIIKCVNPEQTLSSRFVQITIHRLAFNFAMAADPVHNELSIHRKCVVWKNGIAWRTRTGVDSLVEITENNLAVYIRSRKECELAAVKIRSAVMAKILQTKCEILPKTSVEEYLVPRGLISYPIKDKATLIRLSELAKSIVSCEQFCFDTSGNLESVAQLLYFESFDHFGQILLEQLFLHSSSSRSVDDRFLAAIADRTHFNTKQFMKIFDTSSISLQALLCQVPPGEAYRLLQVFKLWKQHCEHGAIYSSLCQTLSEYSIFAGRNPLGIIETSV